MTGQLRSPTSSSNTASAPAALRHAPELAGGRRGVFLTALAKEPFVSITTFRRDGTPVSVPVWCAADNGTLLVFSEADSWKVKRIRRDAHVRLAPCSARGTPRGPAIDADATLLEETTKVQALLARKYPWAWPAYRALMVVTAAIRRLRRQAPAPWLTIRITPR